MMHFSDLASLALVLAAVVCIAILARALVEFTSWLDRRQAKAERGASELVEQKAQSLLREVVGEEEYSRLSKRRYVEVQSPHVMGRVYRIHLPQDRAVDVYERDGLVARLCIHPQGQLPESDVLLAHKLMIEGNEAEYLCQANVVAGGSDCQLSMPRSPRPASGRSGDWIPKVPTEGSGGTEVK